MALLIRAEDAPDIITMEEAIDAVEAGFRLPLSRADREHKPEPGVPPAQNRAVSLAPMPCSGGALSFTLSRRVASIDSSRDPGAAPARVRRQPRL